MGSKKPKPRHPYKISVDLDVVYLSNDVHDQSFYEMLAEIFHAAQQEYRKYEFSINNVKIKEQPE